MCVSGEAWVGVSSGWVWKGVQGAAVVIDKTIETNVTLLIMFLRKWIVRRGVSRGCQKGMHAGGVFKMTTLPSLIYSRWPPHFLIYSRWPPIKDDITGGAGVIPSGAGELSLL